VFLLDSLLIGGLRFVLDKVAKAADAEMDDEARLREILLDGQMQLDAGEMSEAEYADLERDVLKHLSEARRRRTADSEGDSTAGYKVTGAEVDVQFSDDDEQQH
jgi:gas vesicle protein GvpG